MSVRELLQTASLMHQQLERGIHLRKAFHNATTDVYVTQQRNLNLKEVLRNIVFIIPLWSTWLMLISHCVALVRLVTLLSLSPDIEGTPFVEKIFCLHWLSLSDIFVTRWHVHRKINERPAPASHLFEPTVGSYALLSVRLCQNKNTWKKVTRKKFISQEPFDLWSPNFVSRSKVTGGQGQRSQEVMVKGQGTINVRKGQVGSR